MSKIPAAVLMAIAIAAPPGARAQTPRPVDDLRLRNAAKQSSEWLTYGFTPAETRYSPAQQINASNVARLGLA